jgi:hypothetical protein
MNFVIRNFDIRNLVPAPFLGSLKLKRITNSGSGLGSRVKKSEKIAVHE